MTAQVLSLNQWIQHRILLQFLYVYPLNQCLYHVLGLYLSSVRITKNQLTWRVSCSLKFLRSSCFCFESGNNEVNNEGIMSVMEIFSCCLWTIREPGAALTSADKEDATSSMSDIKSRQMFQSNARIRLELLHIAALSYRIIHHDQWYYEQTHK